MSTVPIDRPPADVAHPHWCDPNLCTVGAAGGLFADHHLSAVRVLDAPAIGDVAVGLQLSAFGSEPLDTVSVDLEVTLTRTDGISIEGYSLDLAQVSALAAALAELLPAMAERPIRRREQAVDGCPVWCDRSHPAGSPMHTGRTVAVELGRDGGVDTGVDIRPMRYAEDRPAVVELIETTVDETRVMDVSPATAREYGLALLAAAAQAEAGAR